MKVIGLAGRAGSGKSVVAKTLAQRPGIEWVDLDKVAWQTYAPGRPIHKQLVEAFGESILSSSGEIDRETLAEAAFVNEETRQTLDALVHPAVSDEVQSIVREYQQRGTDILLIEGALLASSPFVDRSIYDLVLWLSVSEDVRADRLHLIGRGDHLERGRNITPAGDVIVIDAGGSVDEVAHRVLQAIGS
ncbi:dephospho-CoA kinase [Candidatus Bipolaricaulota bacterium]|jgi:dephospho-CoA kinase|nr:dephospho-CoA kinase [Candidatus Bipolaricaulota bacterium]